MRLINSKNEMNWGVDRKDYMECMDSAKHEDLESGRECVLWVESLGPLVQRWETQSDIAITLCAGIICVAHLPWTLKAIHNVRHECLRDGTSLLCAP